MYLQFVRIEEPPLAYGQGSQDFIADEYSFSILMVWDYVSPRHKAIIGNEGGWDSLLLLNLINLNRSADFF